MFNFFKKILVFLVTGTFSVVLAACYGVPIEDVYNKIIRAKSNNGNPIEGLQLTLKEDGTAVNTKYTDSDGEVEIQVYGYNNPVNYSIDIEDIDGAENGGNFKDTTLIIDSSAEYNVILESEK